MRRTIIIVFLTAVVFILTGLPTDAGGLLKGFNKWISKEAIPTVTGQRPIKFDPGRVTITHKGEKAFEVNIRNDKAYVNLGVATIKTNKLKQRLAQAGCLYATGGNIMECAPDVANREIAKFEREWVAGVLASEAELRTIRTPPPNQVPSETNKWVRIDGPETGRTSSQKIVDARGGWQPYEFDNAVNEATVIGGNWNTGTSSVKYSEEFPLDALLVYIDGLGFTEVSEKVIFPQAVSVVWMRINDDHIFDNHGKKAVQFNYCDLEFQPDQGEQIGTTSSIKGTVIDHGINQSNPFRPDQVSDLPKPYYGFMAQQVFDQKGNPRYIRVMNMDPRGPCSIAGIMSGDIVLSFNGKGYTIYNEFIKALLNERPGNVVSFIIFRNNQSQKIDVKIGYRLEIK